MTGKMRVRNPDGGWIEIDGVAEVPTKLSELTSDAAHRTVTDSEKTAYDGKLDADKLPEAVNDALAQAKASGEFDGRDGQDGQPGTDGKDGKTPVKGVDYFTSADQEAIVQQVIAALGTPVFGRVDEDNNIILTGELADGTYTVKYEDAEGNVTDVGIISHVVKEEIINQIPISTDTNGAIFDGDGIKTDTRLNSSGTETTLTGTAVTGYIPVKFNDVVRFKNINYKPEVNSSGNYIALYTPSYAKIDSVKDTGMTSAWNYLFGDRVLDDSGRLIEFRFADGSQDYGYIRVSAEGLNAESIITINQPIE